MCSRRNLFTFLTALITVFCIVAGSTVTGFGQEPDAETEYSIKSPEGSREGKAYAVLDTEGTLVFTRSNLDYENGSQGTLKDLKGNSYSGIIYAGVEEEDFISGFSGVSSGVVSAYVADGFVIAPKTMSGWFGWCNGLVSFDGTGFDTSEVIDMSGLFAGCSSLNDLDISGFNTENVTDTSWMFNDCVSLTSLDLSHFSTGKVTSMELMFARCEKLAELDISGFDTGNVIFMNMMFSHCEALETLDVSGFDTSKVVNMFGMFDGCWSLSAVDVSGFVTTEVMNMGEMFNDCSVLAAVDVSGFDTANVTDVSRMFTGCCELKTIDVSGFDTSNVTGMSRMFAGCAAVETLDVTGFDTADVISMDGMFSGCESLQQLDVSSFNTSSVLDMSMMFSGCTGLTALDLDNFNTSNVTSMDGMFAFCKSLTNLDLSHFNTEKVRSMKEMFEGCKNLQSLNLGSFVTSKVTNMSSMFSGCTSLASLDLSRFNTVNVTAMGYIFYNCDSLRELDLSGFNTANAKGMEYMFASCDELEKLDISSFSTRVLSDMNGMFDECGNMHRIKLGKDFKKCYKTGYLPVGNWHHGDLVKTETELWTEYPTNAWQWEGWWIREFIEIEHRSITVVIDDVRKINAQLVPDSLEQDISWSSNDLTVAEVDQQGNVRGISAGTADIIVTAGDGTVSNRISVTVIDKLSAPAITTARLAGDGILVEWDAVEGAKGYVVYRRAMTSSMTEWTTFARWNNTTELSFLDTRVYTGTKYQYGVKAYYGDDPRTTSRLGPVGPMSTALIFARKPAATDQTFVENKDDGILVSWSAVGGATGYIIYRRAWSSTTDGWTSFERWNNTTDLNFLDTKVYAGTRYQYGVKAYNGNDPKNMSYVGEVGPLRTNVRITTRTIISAIRTWEDNQPVLTVKWSPSRVFTGYQLEFTSPDNEPEIITIDDPTLSIYSKTDAETLRVRVRSYHEFEGITYYGNWSALDVCE